MSIKKETIREIIDDLINENGTHWEILFPEDKNPTVSTFTYSKEETKKLRLADKFRKNK